MNKKNHTGIIENIKQINSQVYSIEFSSPTLIDIQPGQYVSILCDGLTLRRPFSVADFSDGKVTVLFKQKGKGTEYISHLQIGDKIEFSAPLGNTFSIDNKKTLLIGAGIGVAPLFYLKKQLEQSGAKTFFAAGFLSKEDILGDFNFVSTDDGSFGEKGSICEYLEKLIQDFAPERIVSCAPSAVLRIIAETARKHKIDSEIAMEKVMACGIGVCRGCVIEVRRDGRVQNATVCKDGPVFKGEEVVW
jgi:dihydroorotate dehydrogenase electron transfer subunit